MTLSRKNLIRLALATASILLLPLVAMQFTREVTWTLADFISAGALLFGTGFAYMLVAGQGRNAWYRLAAGIGLAAALLLIWLNGAVGLIGSEHHPANLLYGGVLAVVVVGALLVRLQAQGMAGVLLATALAQLLVPVLAMLIWQLRLTPDVVKAFGANLLFVVLWGVSAWLFRRAGTLGSQLLARAAA